MTGCLLGATAVAGGAFGAHGLEDVLEAAGQAANWETAFRYCMYHALAVSALGPVAALRPRAAGTLSAAAVCLTVGTLVFSGCLAALALTGLKILGAIVPIGGTLLIVGWLLAAWGVGRATQT